MLHVMEDDTNMTTSSYIKASQFRRHTPHENCSVMLLNMAHNNNNNITKAQEKERSEHKKKMKRKTE